MIPQDTFGLDLDDESGGTYIHSAQSRALLMQKLTRESGDTPNQQQTPVAQPEVKPQFSAPPESSTTTRTIVLINLFDPTDPEIKKESGYFVDLKEEIEDECGKYGKVEKVNICLLYTSPSPRDRQKSRMPSSA
eukprot:TRINITY_DN3558_c0_g1_i8.p2 TRINITY_DN3558_c0_g1~~TRINITY_DN3558_c0_g1_i8.p2  ORF type:complete len:134 (+),score=44.43 TRINITY_DN3558_c0_g1_i8:147-548(+)